MNTTAFQTTYFEVDAQGALWPLDPATIQRQPDGGYHQVVDGAVTTTYTAQEIVHARLMPITGTESEVSHA
ncbi:hypothetical protein [Sulfobacillus harzensis]|uniref:Uncharacterized protein n=1 Tax=Sulfobacillus harzensis TaxID=2729629 RepID=A0A7Y0Q4P1_9FIRM|nr:hypothetical protein [Sulfobacillus harzensis]NMP24620.1 hypothetical protein [Sulfobacillus harzensis]